MHVSKIVWSFYTPCTPLITWTLHLLDPSPPNSLHPRWKAFHLRWEGKRTRICWHPRYPSHLCHPSEGIRDLSYKVWLQKVKGLSPQRLTGFAPLSPLLILSPLMPVSLLTPLSPLTLLAHPVKGQFRTFFLPHHLSAESSNSFWLQHSGLMCPYYLWMVHGVRGSIRGLLPWVQGARGVMDASHLARLSPRVATAQEKQGIWKSIFPDRENTGNLLKNIKNMFLHREFTTNTGKIWVS